MSDEAQGTVTGGGIPLHDQAMHLRLSVVENENARLRRFTTLLMIGVAGVTALAAAGLVMARAALGAGTHDGSAFVLRDEAGIERGAWRIQENGATMLSLNDRNGIGRVRATVLEDGAPGLALADAKGRSRVVVSLLADLTATLVFADDEGNTRAVMGMASDGSATIVFADRNGQTRAALGVDADGSPVISVAENATGQVTPPDTTGSRPPD